MPNNPGRSVGRGRTEHAPPHFAYRPLSGRAEYVDDGFAFNRYTCCHEYEDFHGFLTVHPGRWKSDTVTTAGTPTAAIVADADNGEWKGTLAANAEAESARLTWGDNRNIPSIRPFRFEAYVKVPVAIAAAQRVVIGLASDYNVDFDATTKNFWFRLEATSDLLTEADDNVTNTDDQDTGYDVDTGYHLYTILSKGDGSVVFFYDKNEVDIISGLVYSDTTLLQPFIAVQKASGTGVPAVTVDFVDVWWERF